MIIIIFTIDIECKLNWKGAIMASNKKGLYGKNIHTGEYTLCEEQDPAHCRNHVFESHQYMTPEIAAELNAMNAGFNMNAMGMNTKTSDETERIERTANRNILHDYLNSKPKPVNLYPVKASGFKFNHDTSKIIKPIAHNGNDGYMGGHKFIGGKADETHGMEQKEVAKLMRKDMTALKKNNSIPSDWKVSIKSQNYSGGNGSDIRISAPADSQTPAYRTMTWDDYKKGGNNATINAIRDDMQRVNGQWAGDENSFNEFMRTYGNKPENRERYRVMTDDARNAYATVQAAAMQYGESDTNGMVDYFHSWHMPSMNGSIDIIDKK